MADRCSSPRRPPNWSVTHSGTSQSPIPGSLSTQDPGEPGARGPATPAESARRVPPAQIAGWSAQPGATNASRREVTALLATGYSNRQISETLLLAVSTVERHVVNILGKLNLSSRPQVAAWASGQAVAPAPDGMLRSR